MRSVVVCLLAVLVCATRAHAAGELGQIWLGAHAAAATNAVRFHSTNVGESTSSNTAALFRMPSDGQLLNLVVQCAGAPGTGKKWTWSSYIKRGSDVLTTHLTCPIQNSATSCADWEHIDSFQADDVITFIVTTTTGTATDRDCVIGVQVADPSDASKPHNPLILFGDATGVSPTGAPRYGAPSITAATQRLNQTDQQIAGFVVPVGPVTFSHLCVQLDTNVSAGKTEKFYLRNVTQDQDSEALTLGANVPGGCKSVNLSADAGDRLTVKFDRGASGESRTRMVTLEYTGGGGWIGSSAPWTSSTTKYYTMQEGTNPTPNTLPQRVSQSGVIRNLFATADGYAPTPPVITLWKGASTTATPQMSPQALSVVLPTRQPTPLSTLTATPTMVPQSDTHEILVHQGDYIVTEVKATGSTSGTTMWGYEFVPSGARYAVNLAAGGSGTNDWADNSHWAYTSGGPGGAPVPTEEDACYVDIRRHAAIDGDGTAQRRDVSIRTCQSTADLLLWRVAWRRNGRPIPGGPTGCQAGCAERPGWRCAQYARWRGQSGHRANGGQPLPPLAGG